MTTKALVILSGGQDSSTCCAIACHEFDEMHAVTFNYGQKHAIEIESAIAVGKAFGAASHELIDLGAGILKSSSPLVSSKPLGKYESIKELPTGVEPTFIPGRNVLFLTIAANRAAALGTNTLITGLCEEDFAGYWDCRSSFVDRMAEALGDGFYGNPKAFRILTPLMNLNKARSVKLAAEVMGDRFDEILSLTHTCYDGVKGGCGSCHACHLRDRGFREAGIDDPIWKFRKP